jgi:hypothetical protein
MANIAEYREHISQLVTDLGIIEETGGSGRAWKRNRKIRILLIKSAVSYATALHWETARRPLGGMSAAIQPDTANA